MRRPQLSPEQAINEAVALFKSSPVTPSELGLRSTIEKVVEAAKKEEKWHRLSTEHREAIESIQKAAQGMLKGLGALRELAPWVTNVETGQLYPMYDVLPSENLQQLEVDLKSLSKMGGVNERSRYRGGRFWMVESGPWAGRRILLRLPAKKLTRPRIPEYILNLHRQALGFLERCEMPPSLGTGGNVAKLGALLCAAAGFTLKQGESTKAARLARYPEERFAYEHGVQTRKRTIGAEGTTYTNAPGLYLLMRTSCEILSKRHERLNNPNRMLTR